MISGAQRHFCPSPGAKCVSIVARESAKCRVASHCETGDAVEFAVVAMAVIGIGLAAFVVRLAGFRLIPKPLDPQHHDIAGFDGSDREGNGSMSAFQR